MEKSTEELKVELMNADDFDSYMDENINEMAYPEEALEYIRMIIDDNKIKRSDICNMTGVGQNQMSEVLSGKRNKGDKGNGFTRNVWLKICCYLALEAKVMGINEVDRFLKDAKIGALSPRQSPDKTIIYAISHDLSCEELDELCEDEGEPWRVTYEV